MHYKYNGVYSVDYVNYSWLNHGIIERLMDVSLADPFL